MATYNAAAVSNAAIGFQKGMTIQQGRALRDNPIAIIEGAAGAPRIQFAALGSWFSTAGAVGSYVFGRLTSGDATFGSTYAGSGITPSGVLIEASGTGVQSGGAGSPLSGQWRAMGNAETSGSGYQSVTLFIRIS